MRHLLRAFLPLLFGFFIGGALGFSSAPRPRSVSMLTSADGHCTTAKFFTPTTSAMTIATPKLTRPSITALHAEGDDGGAADPGDIIARKIIVVGDVDGGYYRSCVKNEVSL